MTSEEPPCRKRARVEHTAIAQRFIEFCNAMDAVDGRAWCEAWLQANTRNGPNNCKLVVIAEKNARVTVPHKVRQRLEEAGGGWTAEHVQATWMALYVAEKRPVQSEDGGWRYHECSHLCVTDKCANADHLAWESKRTNQSRGHMKEFCQKQCPHGCGKILCHCAGLHDPPCVERKADA